MYRPFPWRVLPFLLALPLYSQTGTVQPQPTARDVVVDVVARDAQGQTVSRLTEKDFQVSEKVGWAHPVPGKVQSFRTVALTGPRATSERLHAAPAGGQAFSDPDALLTVMLVDGINTDLSSPAIRQQFATMADTLTDKVPVALLQLGEKLDILQDFTSDPKELQSTLRAAFSVNHSAPGKEIKPATEQELKQRLQLTLAAMRAVGRHLAGYPGRKKLVWISSSFPFGIAPDPSTTGAEDVLDYRYQRAEISNAMTSARVALYPARPQAQIQESVPPGPGPAGTSSPPPVTPDFFSAVANMKGLAQETGGMACIDENLAACLTRVLRDGLSYYEIRYQPPSANPPPGFHRIDISTSRHDAHLSYPRYYYVPGNKPAGPDFELKQAACDDPMTATVLNVTAQPTPDGAHFSLTVDGSQLSEAPSPDKPDRIHLHLDFAVCSFDAHGDQLQHFQYPGHQDLGPDEFSAIRRNGFRGLVDFQPDPKTASLRWLVRNSQTGDLGSADMLYQPPHSTVAVILDPQPEAAIQASTVPPPEHAANSQAALSTGPGAVTAPPVVDPGAQIRLYCQAIAGTGEHSQALADTCVSVLALSRKMPNVICDREMQRYWHDLQRPGSGPPGGDTITATVAYVDGLEQYTNLRRNGQLASEMLPALTASWSVGEFASILEMTFAPANNARFHFLGEKKLHSLPALVFGFEVAQDDNELYYLRAMFADGGGITFFPSYTGKIWLGESNLQLLRLERETGEIPSFYPINRVTTVVDYSDVPLGDNTHFVLPVRSEIETCSAADVVEGNEYRRNRAGQMITAQAIPSCGHNIVRFTNWHKFAAKSHILTTEKPQ